MAHQSLVSSIVAQDDLCNWEFINQAEIDLQSDGDDSIYDLQIIDYLFSSSDHDVGEHSRSEINLHSLHDDLDDLDDDVIASPTTHIPDDVNCVRVHDFGDNLSIFSADLGQDIIGSSQIHTSDKVNFATVLDFGVNFINYSSDQGYNHRDDVEEDESDDYGVDDELVPWEVKGKLERHRIRKLGKRTFSKRSGLIYTKPGCVRGKHGLGLKAF